MFSTISTSIMCYDLHYQDEGVFPVVLMRSPAVLFIYSIGQCLGDVSLSEILGHAYDVFLNCIKIGLIQVVIG